uniref:BHLH domain-containing protein n=1 Tax=Trichogramma kaykai TaxID=54128 RepID=A0ABD2X056_9HYME
MEKAQDKVERVFVQHMCAVHAIYVRSIISVYTAQNHKMLQSACQQQQQQRNQPVSACCSSQPVSYPNGAGARNLDISVLSQCCEYGAYTECSDHVGPCSELINGPVDVEDLAEFCRFLDQGQTTQACQVPAQQQQHQQPTQPVAQNVVPMDTDDTQHYGQPRVVQCVNSAVYAPSNNYYQVQQVPNVNGVVSTSNSNSNYTQPVKRVTIDVEDLGKFYNHLGQSNGNTCQSQITQNCNYAVPQRQQQHQQQQHPVQPIQCPSSVNSGCGYSCQAQQPAQQHVSLPPIQNPNNYVPAQLNQAPFIPPSMTVEQAAFNYCTDNRWMACPATSYCPLYDESQRPLTSWQALPCAQSFQNYYLHDEDALEEYLSNEKRKEKSRDAARNRRHRESNVYADLADELPVPACEVSHLDKASIMRLAIAHVKTRQLVGSGTWILWVRVSLTTAIHVTTTRSESPSHSSHRRSVIHCTGRYVQNAEVQKSTAIASTSSDNDDENNNTPISEEDDALKEDKSGDEKGPPKAFLVLVASPVPHPSNIEIALGKYTFLSKHNLNMKFTYADDKLTEFLGWDGSELMGQSLFDFHHALDDLSLDKSFKSLFHKGQCETMSYRFLNKTGGYAWVVTQATLIHCARSQKPQSVVCVNYLLR